MPYVFVEEGSDRIGLIHFQPELLTPQQRAVGHEVAPEVLEPPQVAAGERAVPYWRAGQVVWEVEARPERPELAEAKRVASGVDPWAAPTGAHDAPNVGDHRWYDGRVWRSKIAGNTTVPGSDPRWWEPTDPPAVPDRLRSPLLALRPNVGPDVQALIDVLVGN